MRMRQEQGLDEPMFRTLLKVRYRMMKEEGLLKK